MRFGARWCLPVGIILNQQHRQINHIGFNDVLLAASRLGANFGANFSANRRGSSRVLAFAPCNGGVLLESLQHSHQGGGFLVFVGARGLLLQSE